MMLRLRPRRPCAQGIGRTAGSPVRWLNALTRPAVTNATPCLVVQSLAPVPAVCAELFGDCDGVPSEYDAVLSYLCELEAQCIAEPET